MNQVPALAGNDPQAAVGPDAEAPVAQPPDQVRGEAQPVLAVGQQHEVVAGALTFGEREPGAGRGRELSELSAARRRASTLMI